MVNIDARGSEAVAGTTLSHLSVVNFRPLKLVALLQECSSITSACSAFTSARCEAHQTAVVRQSAGWRRCEVQRDA